LFYGVYSHLENICHFDGESVQNLFILSCLLLFSGFSTVYGEEMATFYEGNWENDNIHGYGKYIDADGNIYEGEYVEGKLKD